MHLDLLQLSNQASPSEVRAFIEREKLFGLGCGLVDFTLLASTLITPGAVRVHWTSGWRGWQRGLERHLCRWCTKTQWVGWFVSRSF